MRASIVSSSACPSMSAAIVRAQPGPVAVQVRGAERLHRVEIVDDTPSAAGSSPRTVIASSRAIAHVIGLTSWHVAELEPAVDVEGERHRCTSAVGGHVSGGDVRTVDAGRHDAVHLGEQDRCAASSSADDHGDDVDVAAVGLVVAERERPARRAGRRRVRAPLRRPRRDSGRSPSPAPVGSVLATTGVSHSGGTVSTPMALDRFSAPVRAWFETSFAAPTDAQAKGWPAIADGDHTLLLAPTGSGKTLAAFLWAIDRLGHDAAARRRTGARRVLYISPLRALAFDVEKNLRAPLAGITLAAERLGAAFDAPTVAMRTGDTPGKERQQLVRNPPDILITTPESLYLMLTSRARETLRGVETVIIDEIHALAPTKRGAHLMLSLERLEAITDKPPQRIGLSATQRPLDEIARFLGGQTDDGTAAGHDRRRRVAQGARRRGDRPGRRHERARRARRGRQRRSDALGLDNPEANTSIWPHVHPRILELIRAHRTTIVFCNARRTGRTARREPQRARGRRARARAPRVARARATRAGRVGAEGGHGCAAIVATSSLELGIDMGTVDLVVLVESPGSVARGLQRVGRAGHQVGEPSTGKIFPKYRGDLLEAAIVVERMREGLVEEMRYPRNPLDVLAQQIVAACAIDEWSVDDLVRARAPVRELRRALRRRVPRDARHARGPLSRPTGSRACGRASCGTASRAASAAAKARSASRCRAAARSPTAGCSACSSPTAGASASSTRRWCTRAGSASASCSARRRGASRRSPSTASSSRPRRASRPRRRSGRATGPAGRSSSAARSASSSRELRALAGAKRRGAAARRRARRARRVEPAQVPRRAGRGDRRDPRRPHDRHRALPRRDRRLARLHPHAVRFARARAVGARDRGTARARRPAGAGVVERRRHHLAPARIARRRRDRAAAPRPRRARRPHRRAAPEHVAVRVEVPRERGAARCCSPAAGPASARRCGSSASARPTCSKSRAAIPIVPDAAGDDARVPARRLRRARAARGAHRHPLAQAARRAGRDAPRVAVRAVAAVRLDRGVHVRRRRAARRTARRPRSRSTATCCATSWAPRSCASSSIPRCSPSSSSSCSGSCRPARPATPTTCTTCSPTSARSRSTRSRPAAHADPRAVARRRCSPSGASSRSAGTSRPPRTRPGCATRSAGRSRRGCPPRSPIRSNARSTISSPATRARTCRSRSTTSRPRFGVSHGPCPRRARAGSKPTAASCSASSGPAASSASGATRTCCASLRRRSLAALRHEIEPVDAHHVRALPARVAGRRPRPPRHRRAGRSARTTARRRDPGVGARTRRAARARRRLPARRCSTSCARPARSCGSARARSAPTTAACACSSATACACSRPGPRRRRRARTTRSTTRSATACCARARASGPTSSPRPAPPTNPSCSPRCGISCGRARSPTTRSGRCACRARTTAAPGRPGAVRNRAGSRRLGPPAGAGRWSLVVPAARTGADADRARARDRAATARTPRRRHPRRRARPKGSRGGFAGVYPVLRALEESGRARRGWFVAGLGAAQFALPGRGRPAARASHDRRRRPRPGARARGHRSRAAVRRRARRGPSIRGRPARARPARSSCSSTASAPRSSSGAARLCSRSAGIDVERVGRGAGRGAQGGPPRRASRSNASTTNRRARRRTPPRCGRPASPTATRA